MDRLQSLQIFVAVAEAESFAAGARAVGLSAPSATRGVNALEDRLGVKLFSRTTRRVKLTEAGAAYLAEVRDILAALRSADDAASGAARTPVGRLRITCPQEFGRIYLTPVVTAFLDRHPGVSAEMVMVDRVVNLIEEGFDIALRIGPLPDSGLVATRVGQVSRVVCGSPAYLAEHGRPLEPSDLDAHKVVSGAPLDGDRHWRFGPAGEQVVRVNRRFGVSSVAASIEIARRGWGLCQVLSYQVGPDLEDGSLETVLEAHQPEPLPVHLVHSGGRQQAAKVRAFIDFAADRLRRIAVLR